MSLENKIKEYFNYDKETGFLHWNKRPLSDFQSNRIGNTWNTRYAGKRVGGISQSKKDNTSYFKTTVSVGGELFNLTAHRIVWFLNYGEWPNGLIDHVDGNGLNNRLDNLRDVTSTNNGRNSKLISTNTTGVSGVNWNKRDEKWFATKSVGGKSSYLKCSRDFFEVVCARKSWEYKEGNFTERHGSS